LNLMLAGVLLVITIIIIVMVDMVIRRARAQREQDVAERPVRAQA
jgi:hypothetical protein